MRLLIFILFSTLSIHCSPATLPSSMEQPASSPPYPQFDLQGHRGARGLLPENTVPAFIKALALGVTTLEMDVVISKDRKVVVSHEPWFSGHVCTQPSGRPVPLAEEMSFRIFEMTYKEVARFDCGVRGNPRFPLQKAMPVVKPLLSEVIDAAEKYTKDHNLPPVFYNIETKSQPMFDGTYHPEPQEFTELLYGVLRNKGITTRATIQSFDPRTLQVARRLNPALSLALLVGKSAEQTDLDEQIAQLGFTPAIYSPDYNLVDARLISRAHSKGMRVIPWTVNTYDEMVRLKKLGVDGIITDYPDIGIQLLKN